MPTTSTEILMKTDRSPVCVRRRLLGMVLSLALCLWASASASANPVWIEDFKQDPFGMDHKWKQPQIAMGGGVAEFRSDGEVGRLLFRPDKSFRTTVELAHDIAWNPAENRYIQLRVSRLSPEARLKLYVMSDADARRPQRVLNFRNQESVLPPTVLTVDLHDQLSPETRSIGLMLELDRDNRQQVPGQVEVYIDWIKAGMSGDAEVPGTPRIAVSSEQGEAGAARRLEWTAPADYAGDLYTLSLSRDPLFAGACTTLLDTVSGTSYTLPDDLPPGKWYWTVSATAADGRTGEFLTGETAQEPPFIEIAGSDEETAGTYPYFSVRAGSQGFGCIEKFTDDPLIVEQAKLMLEMGSDAYKFLFGSDMEANNYTKCYTDMSTETLHASHTLVELIEKEPAYKAVFDMPFKYFVMWTYAMDLDYAVLGTGEYTGEVVKEEYDQLYELTRYLMKTYAGTGKIFLIGHWEGDNMLMQGKDGMTASPSQTMIDDMRAWYINRQQAISDARASLPDVTGVEVYHYAEMNAVSPVLDKGLPRLINAVLPDVPVDLVSYSAYNCMNHTDELPDRAYLHLDYILEHAAFTGAWKHGKPVFIGEYGIPMPLVENRPARNLIALKSAASWGSLINLYWSVYTQLPNGNSSLIELDGQPNQEYRYFEDFTAKMHILKHATRVWLGRNPTEIEANWFATEFDQLARHEVLACVIDSLEHRVTVDDVTWLRRLLERCGIAGSDAEALADELLDPLRREELTRFGALLRVFDSDAFARAVSNEQFDAYLTGFMMPDGAEAPAWPAELKSRSERYLWVFDSDAFRRKNLQFANENRVTDAIREMYQPAF
ncbi:MAG: hypothetical protein BWZ08_00280 [candidate division BRC1 bacterium ADurb.BinA292]|nr:MAG: hypothetical protein BWZ08_00280 [candidate division BRC1 bacterium ADurb.BinA292]